MKTFRNFLDEARRNPISKKTGKELNPKIPLYDKLEPLANDSDVYITYVADVGSMSKSAEGFKIGINPNSEYNTPNGIYSYPLKEIWKKHKNPVDKTLDVPFAGEQPFVYIFKPKATNKIVDLKKYNSASYDKDYDKLAKMIINFFMKKNKMNQWFSWEVAKATLEAATQNSKNRSIGGQFWNMTRYTFFIMTGQISTRLMKEYEEEVQEAMLDPKKRANFSDKKIRIEVYENIRRGSPTNLWNKIFRDLGYHGIADKNDAGIIHRSEPTQAVFFNASFIKVIGGGYNKNYKITKFGSDEFPSEYSLTSNSKEVMEIMSNYLRVHGSYGMKSVLLANMLKNVADRCLIKENTIYLKNTKELDMMTDFNYLDYHSETPVKSKIHFYTTDGNRKMLEINQKGGIVYVPDGWKLDNDSKDYEFTYQDLQGKAFLLKFKDRFLMRLVPTKEHVISFKGLFDDIDDLD
jgi:hypothetical protein